MSSDQVIIKCNDEEQISIEKSILIERVPSFVSLIKYDSTLSASTLEINAAKTIVTQIVDYLKTRKINFKTIYDAMKIYHVSKAYKINDLKEECQNFLKKLMNPKTACDICQFARIHENYLIQYYCWRLFDSSWKDIFYREDFLECSESTIFWLLSRPIYESLTEFDLFSAVYSWCKAKNAKRNQEESTSNIEKRLGKRTEHEEIRHIFVQFLPLIRFLTMTPEHLDRVFSLDILSSEERSALREYHETKNIDCLPNTICRNARKRTKDYYRFLYRYHNNRRLNLVQNKHLTKQHKFFCEILVMADCFVTHIQLPIFDRNKVKSLKLHFGGRNLTHPENFRNVSVICNPEGKIKLEEPVFLKKYMQYELNINIPDDQEEIIKSCYDLNDPIPFMFDTDYNTMKDRKAEDSQKTWDYFCFDVTLYF